MDVNNLNQGEKIAGISAVILLIDMFLLDWFGAPGPAADVAASFGVDTGINAWQAFGFIDIILFITVGAAIAIGVMAANATDVNLPVAGSALVAGLGILSVVLIIYRLLDTPYGADRELGVFIGLLAAAGIAAGGWMAMQEEGTSFGDVAGDIQGRNDPPPPPQQ